MIKKQMILIQLKNKTLQKQENFKTNMFYLN